ncbi:putative pathogenesis-related protein isoform X1 [Cinnamomum micranthum f. kanehirae]|uniref:Putative pathogenesis-related protein isoform X1 n=1 Tax=Cinnamomum micranthum f. kanehirae TaxID=337451 RepID=A0A3S3N3H0_9MAGN|nr:putative pathogenesis-related protein isoform X1 [Cinnamomum micranthum f. kanehirae]
MHLGGPHKRQNVVNASNYQGISVTSCNKDLSPRSLLSLSFAYLNERHRRRRRRKKKKKKKQKKKKKKKKKKKNKEEEEEEEMRAKGNQKLNLEQYISFHENPQRTDLTINCLNQIILMHGFIKIYNRTKKDVIDALNSIEPMLILPQRSTLKEEICSSAFLSLEQVKEDLEVLEWKECPVQSIHTLKSVEENLLAVDDLQIICASSTSDSCRFLPSPGTVESRKNTKRPRSNERRKETAMKTADSDSSLLSSSLQSIEF